MREAFVLLLVALTSTGAWAVGARWLGLESGALGGAVGRMLESVGVIVVFFAANFVVGGLLILTARSLGPRFISLYYLDDVTVLVLSVVQGLTFQAWRDVGRRPPPADR